MAQAKSKEGLLTLSLEHGWSFGAYTLCFNYDNFRYCLTLQIPTFNGCFNS